MRTKRLSGKFEEALKVEKHVETFGDHVHGWMAARCVILLSICVFAFGFFGLSGWGRRRLTGILLARADLEYERVRGEYERG